MKKYKMKKEKSEKEEVVKLSSRWTPWIIFIILLIIAGGILLPTEMVAYQVEVSYIDTEQYTIQVPYEAVEKYTVIVPYEREEQYIESIPVTEQEEYLDQQCYNEEYYDQQCYNAYIRYDAEWEDCRVSSWSSNGVSIIRLINIDSEGGSFGVKVGYVSDSGQFIYDTKTRYIGPGGSALFTYSPTPESFANCKYTLFSHPQKEVCQSITRTREKCDPIVKTRSTTVYKDVIKTKTVTDSREETRYRTVTKKRTETREREVRKTRIETKQKEVNWLFGFDALIKFQS